MAERKERFTVSRRKKILENIKENGEVLVSRLSKEFNVSEVTIRNDLEHLERKKFIGAGAWRCYKYRKSCGH